MPCLAGSLWDKYFFAKTVIGASYLLGGSSGTGLGLFVDQRNHHLLLGSRITYDLTFGTRTATERMMEPFAKLFTGPCRALESREQRYRQAEVQESQGASYHRSQLSCHRSVSDRSPS